MLFSLLLFDNSAHIIRPSNMIIDLDIYAHKVIASP